MPGHCLKVTVRSSAQQILPEARRDLVVEIVGILTTAFPGVLPDRRLGIGS